MAPPTAARQLRTVGYWISRQQTAPVQHRPPQACIVALSAHAALLPLHPSCPSGFYKAEVLAVSTLYPAQSGDSSTDQAPLGYPGQIAIKEVVL